MAQYDGSIRINTKIDSKQASAQLMSLENRIVKTADKVESLRSKMDALKNVQIPTQEYQEIQKQIAETEKKLALLAERKEKFLSTGGKESSSAFKRMEYDAEQLNRTLEYSKAELQDLVDTGKAFTLGSGTQEYSNLGQQLLYAENDLSALNQKHDELISKGNKTKDSYMGLGESVKNAFRIMGKALIDIPIKTVKAGINKLISGFKKLGNVALSVAKGPFKMIGSIAKGAFARITKSTSGANKSFNFGLKNILKYGFGIRSLYALFNKLRSAIKEGYENLYNDNERFKNSVDSLKASATTLKNSLAAAFRPLVDIAIPYIQKVMDYMSGLLDSVGQFLAAITGQKMYTKAIKQTTAALKEEKKAAEGYLSPLDEINKYQTNKDSGADTGTGGTMFEELPISDKFKDLAQWFKDMWANADFTQLGTLVGEKLKNALDNIPWDQIKETARKIGSSIATFINGFVEVDGLGYSIGKTLSEAVNTGFEFLNEFVHKLHWDSIGSFIADSLNGIFQNIDWTLIYDTFVTGAKGLGDAINSFVDKLDWGAIANSISNFVNTFFDTVYTYFATIDWMKLGQKIGQLITDSVKGINWAGMGSSISTMLSGLLDLIIGIVSEIDWSEIWKAIIDFLVNINYLELIGKLAVIAYYLINGIVDGLIQAIAETDWGQVWDNILNAFKEFFGIHSPSTVMAEMGTYLVQGLFNGITSLVDSIKEIWESMKQTAIDIWNGVKENLSGIMDDVKSNISSKLDGIKSSWSSAWDGMKSTVGNIMESVKNTVRAAFDWISDKVNDIAEKISSIGKKSSITGGAGSRFLSSSFSTRNLQSSPSILYASPAFEALSATPIPRLATGAVIPANKEFLAVLGDQKHGTNVEAPLDTIKQAQVESLLEVFSRLGLTGSSAGSDIAPIILKLFMDSRIVYEAMIKEGKVRQMSTGSNDFMLGTT